MSDLFINHSSRDNIAAKEFRVRLKTQGDESFLLDTPHACSG